MHLDQGTLCLHVGHYCDVRNFASAMGVGVTEYGGMSCTRWRVEVGILIDFPGG